MSRELDFIDFINEQGEKEISKKTDDTKIKHQYRATNGLKPRSLLENATVDDMQDVSEKDMLLKYQDTSRQLVQKQQELYDTHELLRNIHTGNDKNYLSMQKELQESASRIVSQIDILDRNLIDLQSDPILKRVIDREKAKAIEKLEQERKQRHEETMARVRESAEQTERELRERYQKSRQEALQKRAQAEQQQKQEQLKKTYEKNPPKKEQSKVRTKPWTEGFSLVVVAAFFIIMQIIIYVKMGDQFPLKIQSWEDFGNLFALNLCGIIGIVVILGYIFLFQEIKLSNLFCHLKKSAPTQAQDNTCTEKKQKTMNALTSKRIAAVISILLCITLYLTFLTTVFTNKRDTYICYTTKTGECFHSATCNYISKSAYETTVYEASRKYKPCNFCNPCVERYETTMTERNYIIPLLISAPVSVAIFLLLAYRKEN